MNERRLVMDITIVTAFYDIGRGNWKQNEIKNGFQLPHYLERSTSKYLDFFSRLADIENEMIIFTSQEYEQVIKNIRAKAGFADRTRVIVYDIFTERKDRLETIRSIHSNPEYINKISENQRMNPEYWSAEYVLVTNEKPTLVKEAYNHTDNNLVAWVDFGYCRSDGVIPEKVFKTVADPLKIHTMALRTPPEAANEAIYDAVTNNTVYLAGGFVLANKSNWDYLKEYTDYGFNVLSLNGLVDDDQSVWLFPYYADKDRFELYPIEDDWFIGFKVLS